MMGVKGVIRFQDDLHMGVFFLFWMFNWIPQILKELFTRLIVFIIIIIIITIIVVVVAKF